MDFSVDLRRYEKGRKVEANEFIQGRLYVHKRTGAEIVVVREDYDYETIRDVFRRVWELSHPLLLPVVGFGHLDRRPFIATSFMRNGSLRTFLKRARTSDSEPDSTCKSKCVFGIAAGMALLHSQGIIHRKLRPGTVFLNESFEPVIGLDPSAWENYEFSTRARAGAYGFFTAPEEDLSSRSDVYSFAVLLYGFFTNEFNLTDRRLRFYAALDLVKHGARFERVEGIPDFYWKLITKCWDGNPDKRPSFVDILRLLRSNREEYVFPGSDMSSIIEYEKRTIDSLCGFVNIETLSDRIPSDRASVKESPASSDQLGFVNIESLSDHAPSDRVSVKESPASSDQPEPDVHDISAFYVKSRADYNKLAVLGSGGFGNVFKVKHKSSGEVFALKELHVDLLSDESRKQYEREVLILGTAKHPAMLPLHGCTP